VSPSQDEKTQLIHGSGDAVAGIDGLAEGLAEAAPRGRRTQQERTAESDRRLLHAAMRLIGERGYRGTSLAAIGEAAGYSRGLVTERFGSKQGHLWELVKRMLRVYRDEGRAHSAVDRVGLDELCDMVDNHRRALSSEVSMRAFYALMSEALGPTPDLQAEFRALHRSFRADIARMLRAGIASGGIRADVDVDAEAVLVLGTLRGIAFQWLLETDAIALDAAYDELKRNLRRTLAA
jgi:AcrR family transcriptional regulator